MERRLLAGLSFALMVAAAAAQTPSWHKLAIREPRRSFAMAFDDARGRVVAFGGFGGQAAAGETWEFDGARWQRRASTPSPPPRFDHGLAYDVQAQCVVLFGGRPDGSVLYDDTWLWDGETWTQAQPAQRPAARRATLAYDRANARTVLFGGFVGGANPRLGDTWLFDGSSWTQVFPASSPSPRDGHRMAYDAARGELVLFGGNDGSPAFQSGETWLWDGATWQLGSSSGPPPRTEHALSYDSLRDRTVLFGGFASVSGAFDDTWEWDGSSWLQRGPATRPPARWGHGAAFHAPTGRTIVADGSLSRNDTWAFDGGDWTSLEDAEMRLVAPVLAAEPGSGAVLAFGTGAVSDAFESWELRDLRWHQLPPSGPVRAISFGIASDLLRQRIVMFGGTSTSPNAPLFTHEWDGSAWSSVPSAVQPQPRDFPALAWDPISGKVLMFGGRIGQFAFQETWEWDGVVWTQRFPATVPAGRSQHVMATDPLRQNVVMYGGVDIAMFPPTVLGDTWLWNGSDWVPGASGPPPRFAAAAAFDPDRQAVVMHAGAAGFGLPQLDDTWQWDGNAWTSLAPGVGGIRRSNHGAAFDAASGALVVSGGLQCVSACSTVADTWVLTATAATAGDFGAPCAGPQPPRLSCDTPYLGNLACRFTVSDMPPNAPCVVALSLQKVAPLGPPCSFYLLAPVVSVFVVGNTFGVASVPLAVPSDVGFLGLEVFAHAGVVDGVGPLGGLSLTNGRVAILGE